MSQTPKTPVLNIEHPPYASPANENSIREEYSQISTPKSYNPKSPLLSPSTTSPAESDLQISAQGPPNHVLTSASADNTKSQKFKTAVQTSTTEIENPEAPPVSGDNINHKTEPSIRISTVEFNTPTSRPVSTDKDSGFKNSQLNIKTPSVGNQNLKPQDTHSPGKIDTNTRVSSVDSKNQGSSRVRTSGSPGVQSTYTYWRSIRENFTKIPEIPTQLVAAAGKGDAKRVSEILEQDITLPPHDITLAPHDITSWKAALQAAAEDDRSEVVELLLKVGRKVNNSADTVDGLAEVIDNVAKRGEMAAVKSILRGIAANGKSKEGKRTNLQLAAGKGYISAVTLLLEDSGVNESALEQPKGRTALQAAAEGGHEEIVRFLLDKGANINAPPAQYKGRTALQAAAGGGYQKVVELLLQRGGDAQINAPASASDGRTALQAAAEKGHEDIVKLLVSRGADIDAKPSAIGGISAIEAANKGEYKSISEYFKRLTTHDLHSFCRNDKQVGEEFRKLLDGEASKTIINSRDSAGQTPLHIAAVRPFKDAVVLLLEKGAKTDKTDLDDRNPLESTIFELLKVRELTTLKAAKKEMDTKKTNSDGQPLPESATLSRADGLQEIILLLLKHGAAPHAHNIDQSLAWRKIFPCPENESDEIFELKEIRYPTTISDPEHSAEYKKIEAEIPNERNSYHRIENKLTYMSFGDSILSLKDMKTAEERISDHNAPTRSLCLELLKQPTAPRPGELPRPATVLTWLPSDPKRLEGWNTDLPRLTNVYVSPIFIKYSIKYEFFIVVDATKQNGLKLAGLKLERRAGHISWTMLALANDDKRSSESYKPKVQVQTVKYRSTLNHRWIPNHSLEFFTLFFDDLHRIWEDLLIASRDHLDEDHGELLRSKYGQEQTSKTTFYLEHLFADARTWSQFRAQLTSHVQICNKTLIQYKGDSFFSREVEWAGCSKDRNKEELALLSERVLKFESRFKEEITALEIKTQGLVDFKLNLLQAYESQRSNTTAVGMKRLSWITFIFLPSMFVASLFGMNIDILSGGPHWSWYAIICVPVLVLVILTWLVCKYIEEHLQNKRMEKNKADRDIDLEARAFSSKQSTFHIPHRKGTKKSKYY